VNALKDIKKFLFKNKTYLILFLIVSLGLYFRFYKIDHIRTFGWDQARDAWKVRDIIKGQLLLVGPQTGIGRFHLGPLWYYLLVPFYYLTNLDPIAANYLNFIINIFNFFVIFFVTKRIFNEKTALLATLFYSFSSYLIEIGRVPWNVSPVIGVSVLIFYFLYQVVINEKYKNILWVGFLTGLFFHLHFSAVFLPLIIMMSLIYVKDKKKALLWSIYSLPFFLVWFIPLFIYELQTKYNNINLFNNFLRDYLVKGFHLRFFLYRINDGFIQFQTLLSLPKLPLFLKFILPAIFFITVLFEKNKKEKITGYLISFWFIVPSVIYSFYGGQTSEYYVLINSIMVIYVLLILQNKLLKVKLKIILYLVIIFWSVFFFNQVKGYWVQKEKRAFFDQRNETLKRIRSHDKIEYKEGEIESYLWQIWVEDKK